jgi:hypothetical protein
MSLASLVVRSIDRSAVAVSVMLPPVALDRAIEGIEATFDVGALARTARLPFSMMPAAVFKIPHIRA